MPSPEILFFLCLNNRGGAELAMIRLAQALRMSGRLVTMAIYGAAPELARAAGFEGEVIDLGCRRTIKAIWPLYQLLRGKRFAVVVSALTHTNLAVGIAARLASRRIGVVVTEHGLDGIETCAASPWFAAVVRRIYARAAAVVAVSEGLAQRWRSPLSSRVTVKTLYNPVIADRKPAAAVPHPWLAQKNIPVVIGVGRLKEEKNFALLIRAFAVLASQRAVRLVILGEGEQRALLENLAQKLGVADKILMPGFVTEPQDWLAHADLFVCSSQREGFGNAIVEALACGLRVVATDCPYGPVEILDHGRYGRLVVVDDVAALAQAMAESLDLVPDVQALRRRADDFTVARCVDSYAALVDTLTASR